MKDETSVFFTPIVASAALDNIAAHHCKNLTAAEKKKVNDYAVKAYNTITDISSGRRRK